MYEQVLWMDLDKSKIFKENNICKNWEYARYQKIILNLC